VGFAVRAGGAGTISSASKSPTRWLYRFLEKRACSRSSFSQLVALYLLLSCLVFLAPDEKRQSSNASASRVTELDSGPASQKWPWPFENGATLSQAKTRPLASASAKANAIPTRKDPAVISWNVPARPRLKNASLVAAPLQRRRAPCRSISFRSTSLSNTGSPNIRAFRLPTRRTPPRLVEQIAYREFDGRKRPRAILFELMGSGPDERRGLPLRQRIQAEVRSPANSASKSSSVGSGRCASADPGRGCVPSCDRWPWNRRKASILVAPRPPPVRRSHSPKLTDFAKRTFEAIAYRAQRTEISAGGSLTGSSFRS